MFVAAEHQVTPTAMRVSLRTALAQPTWISVRSVGAAADVHDQRELDAGELRLERV